MLVTHQLSSVYSEGQQYYIDNLINKTLIEIANYKDKSMLDQLLNCLSMVIQGTSIVLTVGGAAMAVPTLGASAVGVGVGVALGVANRVLSNMSETQNLLSSFLFVQNYLTDQSTAQPFSQEIKRHEMQKLLLETLLHETACLAANTYQRFLYIKRYDQNSIDGFLNIGAKKISEECFRLIRNEEPVTALALLKGLMTMAVSTMDNINDGQASLVDSIIKEKHFYDGNYSRSRIAYFESSSLKWKFLGTPVEKEKRFLGRTILAKYNYRIVPEIGLQECPPLTDVGDISFDNVDVLDDFYTSFAVTKQQILDYLVL